jgi:PAS domain S-box-containing protein
MRWQSNPYTLTLFVAALISIWLMLVAWRRRSLPGATAFAVLMLAVADWSLSYAFELAVADVSAKTLWAKVEYIGIVTVPLAWFLFVLQYTRQDKWLTIRTLLLLSLIPLLTLSLVWTNEFHHLIWDTVQLDTSDILPMFSVTYGPAFFVHLSYSYILLLLSTILLLRSLWRSPQLYRQQAAALLVVAFSPWVGNILYLTGWSPFPFLDLTPLGFTLSGLIMAWSLYRYRLLDIVPVAHEAVIRSMADGVVVLDLQNRIADLNPAAERILGQSAAELIGQPAGDALSAWPDLVERYRDVLDARAEIALGEGDVRRLYELRISPLYDQRGRLSGRLVAVLDITERKRAEEELKRQALTFENILDSVILTDMEGRIVDCNLATETMFGYAREKVLGQTPGSLWHRPEASAALIQQIAEGIQREGRWSGEIDFIRKDGTVGVAESIDDDIDFSIRLQELNEEFEILSSEARELEERISNNISEILESQD